MLNLYLVERSIPNLGRRSETDLEEMAIESNKILDTMGEENIVWKYSFVADNKIFCVYQAKSIDNILDHAKQWGYSAENIFPVSNIMTPEWGKDSFHANLSKAAS